MKKKWTALFMAAVMAASFSTGALAQDGDEAEAAEQLLEDLTGSYIELWPVLFSEEYEQEWLDASAAIVGEENAQEAVDALAALGFSPAEASSAVGRLDSALPVETLVREALKTLGKR